MCAPVSSFVVSPFLQLKRRFIPKAVLHKLIEHGLDPVLARVFAARGVQNAQELGYTLANLPDFSRLKGARELAWRLWQAIEKKERIVVVADYDADGATACAVAIRGLRTLGATIDFIVPDRMKHGYGLTPDIVELATQLAPNLLLTVDNGIASVDGVREAARRGIDVLITDHHLPGAELPTPAIIVNPDQPDCPFPLKHLAGVGVMFYVLTALRALMRENNASRANTLNLAALLDLVALGTIADVVQLDHANRILVAQGLSRIRSGKAHPGIRALFSVSGKATASADAFDLGFAAAPRLNAAGRLADMSLGIRCLIADDPKEALRLATELDELNHARRSVEADIQQEALAEIQNLDEQKFVDQYTLCVAKPEWHPGVIGIVASRLKERFHRPTIVFGSADQGEFSDELRGSGRSIAGLHMRDALDSIVKRAPHLIHKFGGHAMAAGLTIYRKDFAEFCCLFEEVARENLSQEQLCQIVESDGELTDDDLTYTLAQTLRNQVWGQGFPVPVFDNIFSVTQQIIIKEKHSRLTLSLNGKSFDAMLFGDTTPLPSQIHAAYHVKTREYQELQSLQLIITHWWHVQKTED
ncbi:MAG: single-stranded-DNA-specific exonuclease RecJ [Burkholderiales bacterium]|jgi:single-stranded-DNA-specific exonuclease|nr:single-stranded-DNA-specific exonuclease RecJ [Burkholderiales bacterium]